MCSYEAAGLVVALIGAAAGGYSSYQQGQTQKATARYNERVAENEAQEARNRATEAETAQRLKTARLLSKQRAQLGAGNIELGSGSALQLQEDTILLGEADAMRIRETGDAQFAALGSEAELQSYRGDVAETQGTISTIGSLASGASAIIDTGVADKWFTADSAANTNPWVTESNPLGLTPGQGL